jgi:hopanoid-associated phosphorylase
VIPAGAVVAVGLASEARLLPAGARAAVSGGDPDRLAARLAAMGPVSAVLSFGIAGGLAPGVRTGELLVAEALRVGEELSLPDPAWTARLQAGTGARPAVLAASATLVATPAAKRALHGATHALAVDMESGVAARFAAARAVPFAVLRAVADTAEEGLPRAAADALDAEGRPRPFAVLAGLLPRPWELPALIRLARRSAAAHAALAGIRWDG